MNIDVAKRVVKSNLLVRNRFLYDCSTCGMMVSDYRNDVDWKSYQDGYGDKWLEVFFSYEKYKQ